VGIGAYLVRLGQRTIQNEAPIILTGAAAINKLLGKEVYSSNAQLGGLQIMFRNGVSHIDVPDDFRGVGSILEWLSFVPRAKGEPLPVLDLGDPVERDIQFEPSPQPYDPICLLAGQLVGSGAPASSSSPASSAPYSSASSSSSSSSAPLAPQADAEEEAPWLSGFFDRGSFVETLAGWAKTVVCGRGRLGGIPLAAIAVETRAVEHVIPADPASPESTEQVQLKAGQVWFPDSAYKTAQAIKDFNYGEQLPLIIFANWRGFSGGMRDMLDEILKFGSYIVDNLVDYKQPVFIYIPPHGELRGGAWVVLDPTINPDMMEMYCDQDGCGGVLEPSGTVEIKFRDRDVAQAMRRLDPKLRALLAALADPALPPAEAARLRAEVEARERQLAPTYHQIALKFAQLHDTPGRMKAKGVISKVLQWRRARAFFYFRLRRRLAEERLRRVVSQAAPDLAYAAVSALLREWMGEERWADDREAIPWLEADPSPAADQIRELRRRAVRSQLEGLLADDPATVAPVLEELLARLKSGAKAGKSTPVLPRKD
jgi:acetyl-CoA carboxylase/biotin carboxylase 1